MTELHDRLSAFGADRLLMDDFAKTCSIEPSGTAQRTYESAVSTVVQHLIAYVDADVPLRYLVHLTRNWELEQTQELSPFLASVHPSGNELAGVIFRNDLSARATEFAAMASVDQRTATTALTVASTVVVAVMLQICGEEMSGDQVTALINGERARVASSPAVSSSLSGPSSRTPVIIGVSAVLLLAVVGAVVVLTGGGDSGQSGEDIALEQTTTTTEQVAVDSTEAVASDGDLAFSDEEPADRYLEISVPMTDITDTNPDASGVFNLTFDGETGEVCYDVVAVGIVGPYRSHIHIGGADEKGGIVVDFGPTVDGANGCIENFPVETAAILANKRGHYAELHDISEEYTVRGQLSEAVDHDHHDDGDLDHGDLALDGEGGGDQSSDVSDGNDQEPPVDEPVDHQEQVDTNGGGAITVLDGGTIYLEGPVPDQSVADSLLSALTATGGQTPIVNNLRVVAEAPRPSGRIVIADAIFFEVNSSTVKAIDQRTIDAVTLLAKSRPDWILTVVGHTDGSGSDVYNLELSLARAGSVRDLLTGLGIPAEKLLVRGAGETAPIGDNATPEGRSQNRRIEFEFKPAS